MDEFYFVIENSDGDTNVEMLSRSELLKRMNEEYYGSKKFYTRLPNNTDTNYWEEKILIIKGNVVVPKAEQVITKYNIE